MRKWGTGGSGAAVRLAALHPPHHCLSEQGRARAGPASTASAPGLWPQPPQARKVETLPPAYSHGTRRLCLPVRERGKTEQPPARSPWFRPCRCPQDTAQSQNRTPSTAQEELSSQGALGRPPPPSVRLDPCSCPSWINLFMGLGEQPDPHSAEPQAIRHAGRGRSTEFSPGWVHKPLCPGARPLPSGLRSPICNNGGVPWSFPSRYLLSLQHWHEVALSALLLEFKHGPSMPVPWSPRHVGEATGLTQGGHRVAWARSGVSVIRRSRVATPLLPNPATSQPGLRSGLGRKTFSSF